MDFLNTKIIFLHFEFYNMFVNFKGCWLIFQKYKNLIFGQFLSYFWAIPPYLLLIFGQRNPKELYPKYYWE
jgi:hypothetical protein